MRSLLRDLDTGLLYSQPGKWVQSYADATDFGDADAVKRQAAALAKPNLEIFLLYENGQPAWGCRIERQLK